MSENKYSSPEPNAETYAAMQDALEGNNLSGPFSAMDELFAALDATEISK